MRWSWLRALILGVLLGPAPVASEPVDAESGLEERELATGHALRGQSVRGPGFYVWDEDPREATDWALDLLRVRAEPEGVACLRPLAARSAARPPLLTGDLETSLLDWIRVPAEEARGGSVGLLLCLLPALDRTCLIASWATSPDERVRTALARGLAAPFEALGVRGALEQLRDDPSREVRELARVAEVARRRSG